MSSLTVECESSAKVGNRKDLESNHLTAQPFSGNPSLTLRLIDIEIRVEIVLIHSSSFPVATVSSETSQPGQLRR
jgi:hypothetical protein